MEERWGRGNAERQFINVSGSVAALRPERRLGRGGGGIRHRFGDLRGRSDGWCTDHVCAGAGQGGAPNREPATHHDPTRPGIHIRAVVAIAQGRFHPRVAARPLDDDDPIDNGSLDDHHHHGAALGVIHL